MAPSGRLIDKVPEVQDPMEMEVLILGMPRTGIISLRTALGQIGYKCFHGQMLDRFPELYPLWQEAIRIKYYGDGEPYGRKEYDKLLGRYNVSANFPGSLVAEDLIKAYPNAKVILTTRDVDKWLYSMKNSVDSAIKWSSFDWIAPWDPTMMGPWWTYHKFQHALRPLLAKNGERQAYLDHYDRIRAIVPPEKLLNYSVSDGWKPLCEFLGKEVPNYPFPHVNRTSQFLEGRRRRWWRAFGFMVVKLFTPMAIAVVAASWWYFSFKK